MMLFSASDGCRQKADAETGRIYKLLSASKQYFLPWDHKHGEPKHENARELYKVYPVPRGLGLVGK